MNNRFTLSLEMLDGVEIPCIFDRELCVWHYFDRKATRPANEVLSEILRNASGFGDLSSKERRISIVNDHWTDVIIRRVWGDLLWIPQEKNPTKLVGHTYNPASQKWEPTIYASVKSDEWMLQHTRRDRRADYVNPFFCPKEPVS